MSKPMSTKEALEYFDAHASDEWKEEKWEAEALRKDMQTATKYIQDAIARYRKDRLRSRSKAKAGGEDVFKDLEGYNYKEEIRDSYGWELITESEMNRLMNLWDLRAQSKTKGPYTDRVVEMLERAIRSITTEQEQEQLYEYDKKASQRVKQAKQLALDNVSNLYAQAHGMNESTAREEEAE